MPHLNERITQDDLTPQAPQQQPIDSSKVIGLCIDIDDTLVRWNKERQQFIFNCPSIWTEQLSTLEKSLGKKGWRLAIHIVSAKDSVDNAVLMVIQELKPFLNLWRNDGTSITQDDSFYVGFYPKSKSNSNGISKKTFSRIDMKDKKIYHNQNLPDPALLPCIHISGRNPDTRVSKAHVLKLISEFYGSPPIPAENMYLIDNLPYWGQEISTGSNGTTPIYRFIWAYSIEAAQRCDDEYIEYIMTQAVDYVLSDCTQSIRDEVKKKILFERKTMLNDWHFNEHMYKFHSNSSSSCSIMRTKKQAALDAFVNEMDFSCSNFIQSSDCTEKSTAIFLEECNTALNKARTALSGEPQPRPLFSLFSSSSNASYVQNIDDFLSDLGLSQTPENREAPNPSLACLASS